MTPLAPNSSLLHADRISKSYDGVRALRDVSFELRAGEIHALVGENGAGKSTLIKIITGAVQRDSGEILISGHPVGKNSPHLARSLGIVAIYQQPTVFPWLTVAENIALGQQQFGVWKTVDWNARRERAVDLLKQIGTTIDPDAEAGELNMPQQQLLEIARALGCDAKVLILDEPTACLSEKDADSLFGVLRDLRVRGVGIIYISHRLDELAGIADRVTVLRDGAVVATRSMAELSRQELIHQMVGRELSEVFPKKSVPLGKVAFELRGLKRPGIGGAGVSLSLRAGEIVGLAGLVGAGRTGLAKTIFGLTPAESGEIRLNGEAIAIHTPSDAIRHGIAYLPEDRRRHGVIAEMPITANITLACLSSLVRRGSIDVEKENEIVGHYIQRFAIRTPAIFSPVATLSGGNQQKVVLSRWLATKPLVLILDEPTQGVDVGAKSEIHALMGELAGEGLAILMISSELPELLGMCDRIVVMRSGDIAGCLERVGATQAKILGLAIGHKMDENTSRARESSVLQ
jgi:rhamnose transport system ATP-binding protein